MNGVYLDDGVIVGCFYCARRAHDYCTDGAGGMAAGCTGGCCGATGSSSAIAAIHILFHFM